MRIRLLPETDADWAVEVDRTRDEVLLNPMALGLEAVGDPDVQEQISDVGAAILVHLSQHPGASDEALTTVALAAAARA